MNAFESLNEQQEIAKNFKKDNRLTKSEKRIIKTQNFNRLQMVSDQFLYVNNGNKLAYVLKTQFLKLQLLLNEPNYHSFSIPKKSGGKRMVHAPDLELLKVQRRLNQLLQVIYQSIRPSFVHGFVTYFPSEETRSNIVENALLHVGKQSVLTIDLADFFPSISAKQVKGMFLSKPFQFDNQLATALALLTTYEGKLPQGAPTSPVLSNFICLQLDFELATWAEQNQFVYSRYADDLTFSAKTFISLEKQREIRQIITKFQFVVNEKKVRQRTSNRKQTVTGLTVNSKVNVDRRYIKKVRAMLHDSRVNGIQAAAKKHWELVEKASEHEVRKFLFKLKGMISFIGQVRGNSDVLVVKMREELNQIVVKPSFNC